MLLSGSPHASHREGPGTVGTLRVPSALNAPVTMGVGEKWACRQLLCDLTSSKIEGCADRGKPCNRGGQSVGSQRNVSDTLMGAGCLFLHVREKKLLTQGKK